MSYHDKKMRFSFESKSKANEARKIVEREYPQLIISVTEHATMIVDSTRSITFDTRIEDKVTALGGLII